MNGKPYSERGDCVWLASDGEAHLGAFIPAAIGPIPTEALNSIIVPIEDVAGRVNELPSMSQAQLLVSVKRPDDFVDLAERGMFLYDWTDIHRRAREALRVYEPVAAPTKPITISSLPSVLRHWPMPYALQMWCLPRAVLWTFACI